MKRYVEGQSRVHHSGLPEKRLDDFISTHNVVRIIDAFVDSLELSELGFHHVTPAHTGRPCYHPAALLKLYIYGAFYHIRSSRCLERETWRNVEVMWLLNRLKPDHKTIARFRKDNGEAIQRACQEFARLCHELRLFANNSVAIDGSKFKGVNHRSQNFTEKKLEKRQQRHRERLRQMRDKQARFTRGEVTLTSARQRQLTEVIEHEQGELDVLEAWQLYMKRHELKQVSLSDPDARAMICHGHGVVGYNVQIAVETKNHFIVYHEVTNEPVDRGLLANIAQRAQAVLASETLTVVADSGYYKSQTIAACEQAGITVFVPKAHTSGNQACGLYPREAFRYQAASDSYQCPAGETLIYRFSSQEGGLPMKTYWSSACKDCRQRSHCTTGQQRRLKRSAYEELLTRVNQRLDDAPEKMLLRRETVEHPFGTLKCQMGYSHFLMKGLKQVQTEMSLAVLSYNLKRALQVMGALRLHQVVSAKALIYLNLLSAVLSVIMSALVKCKWLWCSESDLTAAMINQG